MCKSFKNRMSKIFLKTTFSSIYKEKSNKQVVREALVGLTNCGIKNLIHKWFVKNILGLWIESFTSDILNNFFFSINPQISKWYYFVFLSIQWRNKYLRVSTKKITKMFPSEKNFLENITWRAIFRIFISMHAYYSKITKLSNWISISKFHMIFIIYSRLKIKQ